MQYFWANKPVETVNELPRCTIRIPVRSARARPDVIVVMPWNLRDEVIPILAERCRWGASAAIVIPRLEVIDLDELAATS